MKLKLDDAGHVVLQDEKPVYIHDDGKELPFDAPGTVATIRRLNGEAKSHREAKEAAEAALKGFEGIEDPEAAKKALEIIANLDQKKLVDAGKVEEIKTAAIKATEEKFKPLQQKLEEAEKTIATKDQELFSEKVGGAFARSKYIAEKMAIPSDLVQARFGNHFEIKEGKTIAKDKDGNPIYSRAKPGEVAEFEEALEIIVDSYPQKDTILKLEGGGGGARQAGNGGTGSKTIRRQAFETMGASERKTKLSEGYEVVD